MSQIPEKFQTLHFDAVLPSHLLINPDIEAAAKVFYGIVRNLTKVEGYCYASNQYLAELMDVDIRTIQRWLKTLSDSGYIAVEVEREGFQTQRRVFIIDGFKKSLRHDKNVTPPRQKCHPKEDSKKEDSPPPDPEPDSSNKFSSSSSSFPSPEVKKEEMKMKMKTSIAATEEEFEEAWRKYDIMDQDKIPHPKAWFAKVIESSRKGKTQPVTQTFREFEEENKRANVIRNRKIAEEKERKYPKSKDPNHCVICLDEAVMMISGEHKKEVCYEVNIFEWEDKTGWQ